MSPRRERSDLDNKRGPGCRGERQPPIEQLVLSITLFSSLYTVYTTCSVIKIAARHGTVSLSACQAGRAKVISLPESKEEKKTSMHRYLPVIALSHKKMEGKRGTPGQKLLFFSFALLGSIRMSGMRLVQSACGIDSTPMRRISCCSSPKI
ncbi:hypothetical protein BX600DRAFT_81654 [Xylariales sp. PMI_506]|nr:hypothetical protein BX600DRAFT_81654 [Xylariales sp. PMI_506]